MKSIIGYIREFFHEQWNPVLFASLAILLLVSFVINYHFDLERNIIQGLSNPLQQVVFYLFFYAVPYVVALILVAISTRRKPILRTKGLWPLMAFCFVLLALYVSLHNVPLFLLRTHPHIFDLVPETFHAYAVRCTSNLLPGLIMFVPIAIYWYVKDRSGSRLYGFSASGINLRTYASIVLLLMPIVLAASFSNDFQAAYPRYKFGLPGLSGPEKSGLVSLFEICYGVDFVFVELFFRGFMVMAFSRYLGSASILPMVVAYAFIHFQKPLGEAIASIVGGLVLGIISYRTKSIYGGIILHLGVAFLMELAGSLHVLF